MERGKPSPAGISAVLRIHRRNVLMMVSKNTGVKNSHEAEVIAILEALRMLASFFCDKLIVESDSANAIV